MSSKEAFETLTAEQKAALKGHLQANGFKAAVEKLKEATEGEAPEGSGAVSVEVVDAMVRRPPTLTPHPNPEPGGSRGVYGRLPRRALPVAQQRVR